MLPWFDYWGFVSLFESSCRTLSFRGQSSCHKSLSGDNSHSGFGEVDLVFRELIWRIKFRICELFYCWLQLQLYCWDQTLLHIHMDVLLFVPSYWTKFVCKLLNCTSGSSIWIAILWELTKPLWSFQPTGLSLATFYVAWAQWIDYFCWSHLCGIPWVGVFSLWIAGWLSRSVSGPNFSFNQVSHFGSDFFWSALKYQFCFSALP